MENDIYTLIGIDEQGMAEDQYGNPYSLDVKIEVGDEPDVIGQKLIAHFGINFKRVIVVLAQFDAQQMCKIPQRTTNAPTN